MVIITCLPTVTKSLQNNTTSEEVIVVKMVAGTVHTISTKEKSKGMIFDCYILRALFYEKYTSFIP